MVFKTSNTTTSLSIVKKIALMGAAAIVSNPVVGMDWKSAVMGRENDAGTSIKGLQPQIYAESKTGDTSSETAVATFSETTVATFSETTVATSSETEIAFPMISTPEKYSASAFYTQYLKPIDDLRHGSDDKKKRALTLCKELRPQIGAQSREDQNHFYRSYSKLLTRLGRKSDAVKVLEKFIKDAPNESIETHTRLIYADILKHSSEHKNNSKAIKLYAEIANNTKNKNSFRAQAHIALGNARDGDCISNYNEALRLLGNNGDVKLRAQARIGLGNATRGGDRIAHYNTALRLLGEDGDVTLRAQAYIGLGNACDGDDGGITHYHTALGLLGNNGDVTLRAQAYIGLGNATRGNEQVNYYHTALDLLDNNGDVALRAQAYIGLGNAWQGADNYETALRLAEKIGDVTLCAQARIGLGNATHGSDQITHYKEALDLLGDHGDVKLRAQALIGLGNARDVDRIAHYKKALGLAKKIGDVKLRAQAHIGLGNARDGDGGGIDHYNEALHLLGDRGDATLRAQAYISLGNARDGRDGGIAHYNEALRLLGDHGDVTLRAKAHIGLGHVFMKQKDSLKALTHYFLANSKDGDTKATNVNINFLQNALRRTPFDRLHAVTQSALHFYFPELAPHGRQDNKRKRDDSRDDAHATKRTRRG